MENSKVMIPEDDVKLLQDSSCDASDYLVAVSCGAISGLVDIFLVDAPSDSVLGKWTDAQTDKAVMKFAKLVGWKPRVGNEENIGSAIGFLERSFKVNYDQRYTADARNVLNMSTKNHHIKSLSHAPDLIGLFFSILNQFTSTSTFISGGQLITVKSDTFELQGNSLISKLFCGVANWFSHIMSDIAGSSGSRGNAGRGAGIAIPFYELLQFCNFGKFRIGKDKQDLATLSVRVFQEGYDARFGMAMAIPVLLCDLSIRLIWAIKRRFQFGKPVHECIPNTTHSDLREMLLLGHGTLCLMDGADAAIRSGGNWLLFFTRMNFVAWVRFSTLVIKEVCIRVGITLPLQKELSAYKRLTDYAMLYYEKLQKIDLNHFQEETNKYAQWVQCVDRVMSMQQINIILRNAMIDLGIQLPWNGDFDSFMRDSSAHLVFQ